MNAFESAMSKDPEISLFFSLKRHVWRFVLSGIICAALALGAGFLRPLQWKANLLMQIGQVGNSSTLLMDPNNVVQRMKFSGFVAQMLDLLNLPQDINDDPRTKLINSSFTGVAAKGGNFIEMSVNGFSKDEAIHNLQTSFSIIEKEHEQLLIPQVSRLTKNLGEVNNNLAKIQSERQTILEPISQIKTSAMIDKKFSESILLANMLKISDSELRNLNDQKNALEEQLSPSRTFNTKILDKIYVSYKPESRYLAVIALLGLLVGLILAGLWAVWRDKELRYAVRVTFFDASDKAVE